MLQETKHRPHLVALREPQQAALTNTTTTSHWQALMVVNALSPEGDGSASLQLSNGVKINTALDSSRTFVYPRGITVQVYSSGRRWRLLPTGDKKETLADGTTISSAPKRDYVRSTVQALFPSIRSSVVSFLIRNACGDQNGPCAV